MFVIDLKNRTVAEFTKQEVIEFAQFVNYKNLDPARWWVIKNKKRAVEVIQKLIKEGF